MARKKKHIKNDSPYRREESMMEHDLHGMQKAEKKGARLKRAKRHDVKEMHPLMKMGSMSMPHHVREKHEEGMEHEKSHVAKPRMHHKKKHHAKKSASAKKMHKVMKEYKEGKLHSGSKKGPKVSSRKQAIAIGMSEARRASKHHKPKAHHKKRKHHSSY